MDVQVASYHLFTSRMGLKFRMVVVIYVIGDDYAVDSFQHFTHVWLINNPLIRQKKRKIYEV